ncbi:MAG: pyruvate ferredoxin oxidoreductase [Coriobacteriia bacterium]|nr:pyruvate ferredoxin oxidoreductase [Coriobacteriia bacterium]
MTTKVITGNEAAALAARLARVQVIAAYPITPQSPVVESLSAWVESGEMPAEFVTVESEHSALTVCITASTVGARVFTATSANGLAYMNEQVWWAAGARLPIVMCIANRAMAAPWNVLNDQQDSMSERDAGWIQLYCRNNQEILDTTVQAYRIAERVNVPVMVCYDGFLLSHTLMPVDIPSAEQIDAFLPPRTDPLQVVDVNDPRNIGPVTIADPRADADGVVRPGYMEFRAMHQEALLEALEVIPEVDAEYASAIGRAWGGLTWEYMLEDADVAVVAAGSLTTQLTLAVEALRAEGVRVGVLGIRAYRPFPAAELRARLTGKKLAVVFDKALSYGYEGPIAADLKAALYTAENRPAVFGCVCGLGGRDVSPEDLAGATRRAVTDFEAGVVERTPDWINLRPEGSAS